MAGYDAKKDAAIMAVISRYIRGNVTAQNGWIIDDAEMDKLSAKGDAAVAHVDKLLSRKG
ncbi:MAG: hypothetical protein OEL53_07370 [Rhodospirillales bacterium]|nr:hypothetical protein [Rhodospirillales bacterium]